MSENNRLPLATLCLIAIQIAMAFVGALVPGSLDSLSFQSHHPSVVSAIASIFVHNNLFHLLANMLFLASVGPAVEFATGASRFLSLYGLGGIVGVLLHWVITMPDPSVAPLVGASGAIAACVAFYTIRYAHIRVAVLPNVSVPILAIIAVWVLLQGLGAFVRLGDSTGGTAFWAHLGGFASGAALALAFKAPKQSQIQFGHQVLDRMNLRGPAATAEAARRHLSSHPQDIRALFELSESYRQLGDAKDECKTLIQIVELDSGANQAKALRRLGELDGFAELTSLRRMRIAHEIAEKSPDLVEPLLLSIIHGPDSDTQKPEAIVALLDLTSNQEPELLELLKNQYPLHPATDLARAKGWMA